MRGMGQAIEVHQLSKYGQFHIFFEDPHVARQHEADIQLMERAVWSCSDYATCFNSPAMANRWASAIHKSLRL